MQYIVLRTRGEAGIGRICPTESHPFSDDLEIRKRNDSRTKQHATVCCCSSWSGVSKRVKRMEVIRYSCDYITRATMTWQTAN